MTLSDPWYKKVPWHLVRDSVYRFRRVAASVDRPDEDYIAVDRGLDILTDMFRSDHYREGWFLSYHYYGEVANISRPEYVSNQKYDAFQTHARFFRDARDGYHIMAHRELCPISHPKLHLEEEHYSIEDGLENVMETLDYYDIQYELVE